MAFGAVMISKERPVNTLTQGMPVFPQGCMFILHKMPFKIKSDILQDQYSNCY